MAERAVQPKCAACNHSKSFHERGVDECLAMGCRCLKMDGLRPWLEAQNREAVRAYAKVTGVPYSTHTKPQLIEAIVAQLEEVRA